MHCFRFPRDKFPRDKFLHYKFPHDKNAVEGFLSQHASKINISVALSLIENAYHFLIYILALKTFINFNV